MNMRLLLALLLTLALWVPGGAFAAGAAPQQDPAQAALAASLALERASHAEPEPAPAWPGAAEAAAEAMSEPPSALPGPLGLQAAERRMETPTLPPRAPALDALGTGIERPPKR